MKAFNIMKNIAGIETNILSFDLNRISKANSINSASPPDETDNRGSNNKPTNKPTAPKISNIIVSSPSRSRLNLLNSAFMWGSAKYEIEYAKKEKLEIKTEKRNK